MMKVEMKMIISGGKLCDNRGYIYDWGAELWR